ncbi:uncharacterized protein LOC116264736 [Nymphaea colorata]|nr:uncharacterized protein LOC116264736 [Nymphaea colorata]
MGCCLSCEEIKFKLNSPHGKMWGAETHEARADAAVSAGENGVKVVSVPATEVTVLETSQDKPQEAYVVQNEQVIRPSSHALSAAMAQQLPPISETKEVMEVHTINPAAMTGYRQEIESVQYEPTYPINSYASPAYFSESGFFRQTPGRDGRWWHRREYSMGDCPTPLHDGVYNHRIDANKFASLFSDENPNACSIV